MVKYLKREAITRLVCGQSGHDDQLSNAQRYLDVLIRAGVPERYRQGYVRHVQAFSHQFNAKKMRNCPGRRSSANCLLLWLMKARLDGRFVSRWIRYVWRWKLVRLIRIRHYSIRTEQA